LIHQLNTNPVKPLVILSIMVCGLSFKAHAGQRKYDVYYVEKKEAQEIRRFVFSLKLE